MIVIVIVLMLHLFLGRLLQLRHADLVPYLTYKQGESNESELAVDRGTGIFTIDPHVDFVWVEAELRRTRVCQQHVRTARQNS